jgi:hypothetical protein
VNKAGVLSLKVLSVPALVRAAGTLAIAGSLITCALHPAAAQGPETQLPILFGPETQLRFNFVKLQCLATTGDNFGLGSDEIYAVFWVADIQETRAIGKAFRTSILKDVDSGESRSQTVALWHPLGGVVAIPTRDDIIVLAALMEEDDSRATAVRDKVNNDLNARLLAYKGAGLSHAAMVANLKLDMENAINATRKGDIRIGPVTEIRPSNINLVDARSGRAATIEQSFTARTTAYILTFQLSR